MAKNQPKIAEKRADICKRVEKCSSLDLGILDQVLEIVEYSRRAIRRNEACDPDEVMSKRWCLLYSTLHCHDDDMEAALSRFRLLMKMRAENELRKEGKAV